MNEVVGVQKYDHNKCLRFFLGLRAVILCALSLMVILGAVSRADNPNPDWVLVFHDDFSASSFVGKKLKWGHKWNKIEYMSRHAPDWRKHQSRENSLIVPGREKRTSFVRLKGVYGKIKSQSCQTGEHETFACGGIFTDKTFSFRYGYVEVRARFDCADGVWPAIWLLPRSGVGPMVAKSTSWSTSTTRNMCGRLFICCAIPVVEMAPPPLPLSLPSMMLPHGIPMGWNGLPDALLFM